MQSNRRSGRSPTMLVPLSGSPVLVRSSGAYAVLHRRTSARTTAVPRSSCCPEAAPIDASSTLDVEIRLWFYAADDWSRRVEMANGGRLLAELGKT